MRLAVWRCFLGRPRSSSRIRSMTPVKGSSLGLLGGDCRRYPGGTENTSILRTVPRWSPNTREASRMLIPSTITALRTRRYTSTLYIHHTIHGFGYNPMNDAGRYSIQSPFVSNLPPAWSTLPPPITHRCPDDGVHLTPLRMVLGFLLLFNSEVGQNSGRHPYKSQRSSRAVEVIVALLSPPCANHPTGNFVSVHVIPPQGHMRRNIRRNLRGRSFTSNVGRL